MIISVASGKGGTGKTTIAVNLALSMDDVQLIDCDVEEPNAHIFIKPEISCKETVYIPVPEIDKTKCIYCSKCAEVCMFNAISVIKNSNSNTVLVFPELCHGCGSCSYLCPQSAIIERRMPIGYIEKGVKNNLEFIHGKLNIGQAMSPPVIKEVKKLINNDKLVIIDAPPGTSCPAIETIQNNDFCILVTEPTPFGLNDLMLAVDMLREIKIPFGVIINRSDLGFDKLENYLLQENIKTLLKIPFKKEIANAYSKGIPIIDVFPEYNKIFKDLLKDIIKAGK